MDRKNRLSVWPWPAQCSGPFPGMLALVRSHDADGPAPQALPAGRILVVEDEYFIALASEDALTDAGFVVVAIAANADDAVALAGVHRPDLVLMDVRLTGPRDGVDAAAEILERFGISSIFATAQADLATRTRGEAAAHPLGWLLKPFAPTDVVTAARAAMVLVRRREAGG